jgi:lipoprotein-anchoring transpeptidase ErfK/SrfK
MATNPTGQPGATPITAGKNIVVDLPGHTITISDDGQVVKQIDDFSTGRQGHLTPIIANGQIDPKRRYKMHYSSAYTDSHGNPAAMPDALFFAGGCAFHAGDPDLESHGCIHLAAADAAWLYTWAGSDHVGLQILGPNPHLVGYGTPVDGIKNA